jgi:hypothetical protein
LSVGAAPQFGEPIGVEPSGVARCPVTAGHIRRRERASTKLQMRGRA